MGFYLDFKKITIDMLYDYFSSRRLFTSHRILKENITENRDKLKQLGYSNLDDLFKAIKTQKKVDEFSLKNDYDNEYVTILRRHVMSLIAKPRKIADFVRMKKSTRMYLLDNDIKTTKDLFENLHQLESDEMEYLNSIADLCRLRYLAITFLDGIYYSGYKTMEMLSNATPEEVSRKINETMIKYGLSKVKLGIKDSEYLIEDAKLYLEWLNL